MWALANWFVKPKAKAKVVKVEVDNIVYLNLNVVVVVWKLNEKVSPANFLVCYLKEYERVWDELNKT